MATNCSTSLYRAMMAYRRVKSCWTLISNMEPTCCYVIAEPFRHYIIASKINIIRFSYSEDMLFNCSKSDFQWFDLLELYTLIALFWQDLSLIAVFNAFLPPPRKPLHLWRCMQLKLKISKLASSSSGLNHVSVMHIMSMQVLLNKYLLESSLYAVGLRAFRYIICNPL